MWEVIIYLFLSDFDCLRDFSGRKITIKQEVNYLFESFRGLYSWAILAGLLNKEISIITYVNS